MRGGAKGGGALLESLPERLGSRRTGQARGQQGEHGGVDGICGEGGGWVDEDTERLCEEMFEVGELEAGGEGVDGWIVSVVIVDDGLQCAGAEDEVWLERRIEKGSEEEVVEESSVDGQGAESETGEGAAGVDGVDVRRAQRGGQESEERDAEGRDACAENVQDVLHDTGLELLKVVEDDEQRAVGGIEETDVGRRRRDKLGDEGAHGSSDGGSVRGVEMGDGSVRRKTGQEGTGEAGVGAVDGEQRELSLRKTGEVVVVDSEQPRKNCLSFFVAVFLDVRAQNA